MIHVASFSGGKDSTAVLLWLREQGIEHRTIFCDTGWEHPLTMEYIDRIDRDLLGGKLERLKSQEFDGFADMVVQRGVFPSRTRRFCTEELKIKPLHAWIEAQEDEVTVYQGIRAEESAKRAQLPRQCWADEAGGFAIERPIFDWTHEQVFAIHKKHGIEPNPLYLMNAGRVGCSPCVMVSLRELKSLLVSDPTMELRLIELERQVNEEGSRAWRVTEDGFQFTFWSRGTIPDRFCTGRHRRKDGEVVPVPTAADVCRYVRITQEEQLGLFSAPKCMSVYNLCE